jgi:hypothetical protein
VKILLVAMAAALAALVSALVGATGAGAGDLATGPAQYVVRPDPRLCPFPRCGGYWVALANREQTTCVGGAVRPRCYVASAIGRDGKALPGGIPDRALVRGSIEQRAVDGTDFGVLVVDAVGAPVGRATAAPVYRVRDTGIRCVKAPCFFMRARLVATSKSVTVSELVLPAGLTPKQRAEAESALRSGGLFLAGRIVRASDGGRSLRATTVYLSP